MEERAPDKKRATPMCRRCAKGVHCPVGIKLQRELQLARDLHALDDNKGRRKRRVRAYRAWQKHVSGEKVQTMNLVLPETDFVVIDFGCIGMVGVA
jgi:predicted aldo/keto reductase-like oxidoreductase